MRSVFFLSTVIDVKPMTKNTRAIKTFKDIWDKAQPKNNEIIEQIINECSINILNHLNND